MGSKQQYELTKGINVNKAYRQIERLIEQHDKITVIFADSLYSGRYDLRMRVLTKDGKSRVAYKSFGYKNFSGFGASCFVGQRAIDYKKTLELMKEHDCNGKRIVPVAIWYGPYNINKVALGEQWEHLNDISWSKKKWLSLVRLTLRLKGLITLNRKS